MCRRREWIAGLAKNGILESASPFQDAGNVVSQHGAGEFVKRPGDLSGYAIVNVPSEKEAVEIAGSAPHVVFGGTTGFRPCIEIHGKPRQCSPVVFTGIRSEHLGVLVVADQQGDAIGRDHFLPPGGQAERR